MYLPATRLQRHRRLAFSTLASLALLLASSDSRSEQVQFDLDGDGAIDLELEVSDHVPGDLQRDGIPGDRDQDGTLDFGGVPESEFAAGGDTEFESVYDTGTNLSVLWTVEAGDADLDGLFDFAGGHFSPNTMHLFESDGDGGYEEVWVSSSDTPPGAYRDIAFDDTDGDGLGEILGGEVSTLGKVMLFEQATIGGTFEFVHDTVRESDFSGGSSIRRVLTGDTDLDGRSEIIVVKGGSSPTSGLVAIWEHDGVAGSNNYIRVHEYETVSYVFDAGFGDADNDGYPEIILGLGGFGGNPLIIRRIEYDPDGGTWIHHQFTSAVIGLPLTPHVVDFDGDGDRELAYGSSGFVVVYEHTAENVFTERFTSAELLAGNVLGVASHSMSGFDHPGLAGGSFDGDLAVWTYDPEVDDIVQIFESLAVGGSIRRLAFEDDDSDGREELLPAVAGSVNQIQVWRKTTGPAAVESGDYGRSVLTVFPNPASERVRFATDGLPLREDAGARISIVDVTGREIIDLEIAADPLEWDLRDARGRRVVSGVYWVRVFDDSGSLGAATPLVLTQ